MSQEINTDID